MSFDDIAHLDFQPDVGTGLRDRALGAWGEEKQRREEEKQITIANLVVIAHARISEILDVSNATDVVVKAKDKDGDGEVFCRVDGMEFKVNIVYPAGGGDEPTTISLSVRAGSTWSSVPDLATLGRYLENNTIRFEEDECATD
jgi:hypothetical protein